MRLMLGGAAGDRPAAWAQAHWALLSVGVAERTRCFSMLVPEEQSRAAQFRRATDQERYVVRRGRLRELLGAHLDCGPRQVALAYNGFGKPYAADAADLDFSISHSCGLAFYVIARGAQVGCDIEWRRPRLATKEVAEQFFSKREVELLERVAPGQWLRAFFNCWTRKEAFVKALGLGVSYPLKAFDVSVAPGEPAALLRGPGGWSIRSFEPLAGLHVAIAARRHEG
ncbi:MAG TPA: 4'-phosphopantetheinyl transferase superfamily protein [Caulobacteraceae bacterium]|nr:4'-phosphopantetheinyl transferase superfamily protein [Caulobacteraceae bacterium]